MTRTSALNPTNISLAMLGLGPDGPNFVSDTPFRLADQCQGLSRRQCGRYVFLVFDRKVALRYNNSRHIKTPGRGYNSYQVILF